MDFREEKDSLGTVLVPANAYFGAQTQRARENFPISQLKFPVIFFQTLALIKKCAAQANEKLGLIHSDAARAIAEAATEVMKGKHDNDFVVDVFQTGSGTSTNMNMNEVIATRANEILTGTKNTKGPVHPNDDVNCCQSSNDVIPSAIHIAALNLIRKRLVPALTSLRDALNQKAKQFASIQKIGRTHLQDAVVMTLGQEFSGYSAQVELALRRLEGVTDRLCRLALGGTAVGTGLNAHPNFAGQVIALIAHETGMPFYESPNHFESQSAMDTAVEASAILKTIAVSLMKISNDIRLLASGPRCGLGEINLPSLQPGSSIMPGKINPVIPETMIQVCAQVIGHDAAITIGGLGGYFELNTMLPVIAYNLLTSIELMANASLVLTDKCVAKITANEQKCAENIQKSLAIVTNLVPHIGYDRAAVIAGKAYESKQSIEEVALSENLLPKADLMRILYPILYQGPDEEKI
ncbi:MAG: class II fumarate hydratase [Desulfobacteraceae bacterium]|nr:MAG: class II fumarate hydratase [Desulfobacteraceae bacterium]